MGSIRAGLTTLFVGALAACDAVPSAAPPTVSLEQHTDVTITINDLGTMGGGADSYAADINASGMIAGHGTLANGASHAFLLRNGVFTDLGILPNGSYSASTALDSQGHVVGYADAGATFLQHAVAWNGRRLVDLGTLGGRRSFAQDINDQGQIVGSSEINPLTNTRHAFLWQNGVMKDLGTLGGAESQAFGINNQGQIVGESDTRQGLGHAFLWQNGVMTDLGTLGGLSSTASAINNVGEVVGVSRLGTPMAPQHAFLWRNGVMTDLGLLPGGVSSAADDINDLTQVVGHATTRSGPEHGFAWQNGRMIDLGTLGGPFSIGNAINNSSVIAGFAQTPAIHNHAVTWTVTP